MEPDNVSSELNDDGAKSVERGDDSQAAENNDTKERNDTEKLEKRRSSRSRSRERRRRCVVVYRSTFWKG